MTQVTAYELLAVEAAVYGDYAKGLMALTCNPLVQDISKAKRILDEILKANYDYLPQFHDKKQSSVQMAYGLSEGKLIVGVQYWRAFVRQSLQ